MANYLYNGVELPDISSACSDFPSYKYHVIFKYGSTAYLFICFVLPPTTVVNTHQCLSPTGYMYKSTDSSWVYSGSVNGYNMRVSNLVWANFTVDGIIEASDPIPVNPAPTLDPTALLMGWQVGNRIRQRTKGATE